MWAMLRLTSKIAGKEQSSTCDFYLKILSNLVETI